VPDKLEVLQGPGLVARFGEMALWAGPQASAALQVHLVSEAQHMNQGPFGGDQLANSLIAVLQRGDPEPHAPFAVVGPGSNGLTLFLHGPVQAWDSGRWLAPQPVPGWMVTAISRPWPLIILPYGAPPPPQSQQGNPFDLVVGVVPGAGFVLLRPLARPGQEAGASQVPGSVQVPQAAYGSTVGGLPMGGPGAGSPFTSGVGAGAGTVAPLPGPPSPVGPVLGGPAVGGPAVGEPAGSLQLSGPVASAAPAVPGPIPLIATPPMPMGPATTDSGPMDLRVVGGPSRLPLPLASALASPYADDRPEVPGVRCEHGHFNHPRVVNCLRCGRPVQAGTPQLNGPRPPVGILLADDGSIWALDRGYLLGADPTSAPEVMSGAARAISMRAGPNRAMAPVQAEIQVRGWSAYLVDRGAQGGSYLQGPPAQGWEQLGRDEQREVTSGSHISFGGRVLTYLSAWPS